MSSSMSHKFLIDENVHSILIKFLKNQGYDVCGAPKGVKNGMLVAKSRNEKLIFVTNDSDFSVYPQ